MLHSSSPAAIRLYKAHQRVLYPPQIYSSSQRKLKNCKVMIGQSPSRKNVQPKLVPQPVKKPSGQGRITPITQQKQYTYSLDYWRREKLLKQIVAAQTPRQHRMQQLQTFKGQTTQQQQLKLARQKWKKREDTEISQDLIYKDKERARERSVLLTRQKSQSSFILETRQNTHRMMQRSRVHSARKQLQSARDSYRQTEQHHKFLERKRRDQKEKKKQQLEYKKAFLKNLAMPVQRKSTTAITSSTKTIKNNAPKKRTFPSISSMSLNTKKATLNHKASNKTNKQKQTKSTQYAPEQHNTPDEDPKKADHLKKDETLPSINRKEDSCDGKRKEETNKSARQEGVRESERPADNPEVKPEQKKQQKAVREGDGSQAQPPVEESKQSINGQAVLGEEQKEVEHAPFPVPLPETDLGGIDKQTPQMINA